MRAVLIAIASLVPATGCQRGLSRGSDAARQAAIGAEDPAEIVGLGAAGRGEEERREHADSILRRERIARWLYCDAGGCMICVLRADFHRAAVALYADEESRRLLTLEARSDAQKASPAPATPPSSPPNRRGGAR